MASPPEPPETPESSNAASEFAALTARVEALELQLAAIKALQPAGISQPQPVLQPAPIQPEPVHPPPLVSSPPPFLSAPPPPRPSLENRLGSQVFSRIGIMALLIGSSWALKLAIDNQLIGPLGRVVIGMLAGIGLVLWSERFRRKGYPAFSYALKAVGSGVLYLALWASFQLYHLLPAPVALTAMVFVTAWNAWMAWTQDAELLAAYALVGGFASPALLSSGANHEVFLFTYLAAIDLATVLLVRRKPWPRLLVPALAGTAIYFFGWYFTYFDRSGTAVPAQLPVTCLFLAIFFALFAASSLRSDSDPATPSPLRDILIPLGNAAFIALALYAVLDSSRHQTLLPWVAVLFAAIYLGLVRLQRSPVAAAIHLSLAVVFLTGAIPLKASGHWITLGWLTEGTALLWSARRLAASQPREANQQEANQQEASLKALRLLALAALALGLTDLISRSFWLFGDISTALLNQRFATSLAGIAAFALCCLIARPPYPEDDTFWPLTAIASTLALNLTALQSGVTEIVTYWRHTTGPASEKALQSDLSISAFLAVYGAALLALGFRRPSAFLRWQGLGLLVLTIAKVFLYDVSGLSQGYRVASFLGLGALLLAVSFAYQKNLLGLKNESQPESQS